MNVVPPSCELETDRVPSVSFSGFLRNGKPQAVSRCVSAARLAGSVESIEYALEISRFDIRAGVVDR